MKPKVAFLRSMKLMTLIRKLVKKRRERAETINLHNQRAAHLTGPAKTKRDIMNNFAPSETTEVRWADGMKNVEHQR